MILAESVKSWGKFPIHLTRIFTSDENWEMNIIKPNYYKSNFDWWWITLIFNIENSHFVYQMGYFSPFISIFKWFLPIENYKVKNNDYL